MSVPNGRRAGLWTRIGFNGELHEPGTHWQILGNGRRVYNPVLCRFHSPDRLSPFGRGGINAYAYCGGDPLNYTDPDGTFALPLMMLGLAAGAGGAAALASPSGNDNGGGSATPWIVGGVIAAVALMAGAGMAGRRIPPMKLGNSSAPSPATIPTPAAIPAPATIPGPGSSWANRAGGTSSGTPRMASPRPASPVRATTVSAGAGQQDNGMTFLDMSKLPSPVSNRIKEIRDFGPRGVSPNPAKVPPGAAYKNNNGALPDPQSKTFYHKYPVYSGINHEYGAWRIITGSSKKGGIHAFYVTPTHYDKFFQMTGWRTFQ